MNRGLAKRLQLIAGLAIVGLLCLAAIRHNFDARPARMDLPARLAGPSESHWLGTDNFGRDLGRRLEAGAAASLTVAIVTVGLAATFGSAVGLVAGYTGGWIDAALMGLVDIVLAFPAFVLAMAVIAVIGPGSLHLALALAAVFWPSYSRVVRPLTIRERGLDYVLATRLAGARAPRIILRHILPSMVTPILALATSGCGAAITTESGLSFLGLGVQPPHESWGRLLAYGVRYLYSDPWMSAVAGLCISLSVLGFNLLGDGLSGLAGPGAGPRG
jgi:peptide/nickel transport system permease protein